MAAGMARASLFLTVVMSLLSVRLLSLYLVFAIDSNVVDAGFIVVLEMQILKMISVDVTIKVTPARMLFFLIARECCILLIICVCICFRTI